MREEGRDKAARILATIRDRRLCAPCIGHGLSLGEAEVREAIMRAPAEISIEAAQRDCERGTSFATRT